MSWKDGLLPASFRGVPFFYADTEFSGGRRGPDHEFPLRDDVYPEDMGRKARRYKLQAHVLGDDYFAQRDALIAALEAEGSGTLVHPYLGVMSIQVRTFRARETVAQGRGAFFDIEFVDAGAKPSPTSAIDTAGASLSAAGAMNAQLASSFAVDYSTEGFPAFVSSAATAVFAGAVSALSALAAASGVTPTTSGPLLAALGGIDTGDAGAIASGVIGFCSAYVADVGNSIPQLDDTLTSRGVQPPGDPSYGLAALSSWGTALAAVPDTTPARIQQGANQQALVTLVQSAAACALAQLYANSDFSSAGDADAARGQITDLIDGLALSAADLGDDEAYESWQALYAASADDLATRGKGLPSVVTYAMTANLPALVLAQRFYQDPTRAGELIARNAAPHPLFLPLAVEALSS
jgi:prophage DNA circulation protein